MATRGQDMTEYKADMTDTLTTATAEEQKQLFAQWKRDRDASARDKLIVSVLPLIFSVCSAAQARFPPGLLLEDVVSEANMAVIAYLDTYDPDEASFSTFAYNQTWWAIHNHGIRAELRHQNRFQSLDALPGAENIADANAAAELARIDAETEPLGEDDISLLEDILGTRTSPRGVIGICKRHNLTWRQLFAYMDQIDRLIQENDDRHDLLVA